MRDDVLALAVGQGHRAVIVLLLNLDAGMVVPHGVDAGLHGQAAQGGDDGGGMNVTFGHSLS